mgnify:CR=1 FL=1
MSNNCSIYKFNMKDLLIPNKLILNNICKLKDKRNLFIISIIRFIIYIYLNIIFNNIYNYLKDNFALRIILYIFYSILLTSTIINFIIIYQIYKKKLNK